MERLDLNQLLVFTRIVQSGSLSTAARRLGLPKSTVSRRLAGLEQRLGVRLVERSTRRLRLTDAGGEYYRRCHPLLEQLDEAERQVRQSKNSPSGTLHVTAPVDLGLEYLDRVVVDFSRRYPDLRVVMTLTGRVVDLIGEGYDVAIRAGSLQDSSLIARQIVSARARLYAAPSYLRARGVPASLKELPSHDCILFGDDTMARWRFEGPNGTQEVAVHGTIASNDFGFIRRAAVRGAGIARMPTMSCVDETMKGRLVPVLPEYSTAGVGLYVVYPSARHLPAKVRVFVDFVVEAIQELRLPVR